MIKGCAKRVVVVKDADNGFFEEAFFIVRPRETPKSEEEYLDEAKSILKSGISTSGNFSPKKRQKNNTEKCTFFIKKRSKKHDFLLFFYGFFSASFLVFLLHFFGILPL
ncbi:MAG: hypothetical protein J6036_04715 [Clostridia bacterium]|nr:hypothetical protein [Clostridia bacterium]